MKRRELSRTLRPQTLLLRRGALATTEGGALPTTQTFIKL